MNYETKSKCKSEKRAIAKYLGVQKVNNARLSYIKRQWGTYY